MKYIVETISSFYEIHVVEAENEEQARKIAAESDWNMSEWLGSQVIDVREETKEELDRFRKRDPYFFNGYAALDGDTLIYKHPDGSVNESMPVVKIV